MKDLVGEALDAISHQLYKEISYKRGRNRRWRQHGPGAVQVLQNTCRRTEWFYAILPVLFDGSTFAAMRYCNRLITRLAKAGSKTLTPIVRPWNYFRVRDRLLLREQQLDHITSKTVSALRRTNQTWP